MSCCIELARTGDRTATSEVVDDLRPRITRMAAYYARRTGEDADDLLQEAWCGLLQAIREIDMSIGSPEQYLLQCARWRLLDAVKRARVRRCIPLDDSVAENIQSPMHENTLGDTHAATFVDELQGTQRTILGYLIAGFTWREVGDALGCTSANVAYHVRQIRRRYEEWDA